MADEEKQIKQLIEPLSKKQQVLFGVICIKRVMHLYTLFDKVYDISEQDKYRLKGQGYTGLLTLLDYIENRMELVPETEIKEIIAVNKNLVPDSELFDLNAIVYIAQLIAQSFLNILRFNITEEIDNIIFCTGANLEIVNQIRVDEYYKDIVLSSKIIEKEFLDLSFSKEMEIEKKTIELIKNNESKDYLEQFIHDNRITWKL